METAIQTVLAVSIILLTAISLAVGVWVFLILKDIKKLTGKAEKIGGDIEETSLFVKKKIKESLNLVNLVTTLANFLPKKSGQKVESIRQYREDISEKREKSQIQEESSPKAEKKFFFRKKS